MTGLRRRHRAKNYPRYHRDMLILDIGEERRIAVRSLGEMKAAEERNELALICISHILKVTRSDSFGDLIALYIVPP